MTTALHSGRWYYEKMSITGTWWPVVASEKPDTVTKDGITRQKCLSGVGARVRRITEVPRGMEDVGPGELQRWFYGEAVA